MIYVWSIHFDVYNVSGDAVRLKDKNGNSLDFVLTDRPKEEAVEETKKFLTQYLKTHGQEGAEIHTYTGGRDFLLRVCYPVSPAEPLLMVEGMHLRCHENNVIYFS